MLRDIIISLITGLVSGLISGFITGRILDEVHKRQEEKETVKKYWENYLWGCFRHVNIEIPNEMIEMLKPLGGINSEFGKAIMNIYDATSNHDDEEIDSELANVLLENFKLAYTELNQKYGKHRKSER